MLERESRHVQRRARLVAGIRGRGSRSRAGAALRAAPYEMVPAQPPLPTPANLPFQFCSGSQTSNRMCESLVGSIAPATRQNGGRLVIALVDPGGVNDPPVTASAVRIVVSGSR